MNFLYRIQRFMSGRYGIDTLFYVIAAFSAVLAFLNIFVRSAVLQILVYALIIFAFVRVMSRNYAARQAENRWFMKTFNNIKQKRDTIRQRKADITHIYKKCPNCRATLRLPHRPGKHTTVCPKCNTSFKVNVRK
ncbi:MAG: hypothetical protein E7561_03520 [Ruminococcaceae bacterium]|nr:hypothetical protein [Oscillospiraceae bacterium]